MVTSGMHLPQATAMASGLTFIYISRLTEYNLVSTKLKFIKYTSGSKQLMQKVSDLRRWYNIIAREQKENGRPL